MLVGYRTTSSSSWYPYVFKPLYCFNNLVISLGEDSLGTSDPSNSSNRILKQELIKLWFLIAPTIALLTQNISEVLLLLPNENLKNTQI